MKGLIFRQNVCILLMACALAAAIGCARTSGPRLVVNSHVDYNQAVQRVVQEELLLNIVRRRYAEAPQFVTVSSISTQISNEASLGANTTLDDQWEFINSGASASVGFEDSPTVTITPLSGEEIAGPLTERMSYHSIASLTQAGYRFDMVLAALVEGFVDVPGPKAGVGDGFIPGSPEYVELITRIGALLDSNRIQAGTWEWYDSYSDISYARDEITPENQISVVALGSGAGRYRSFDGGKTYFFTDKMMYPAMYIPESARTSEDGARVIELLNLDPDPARKIWRLGRSRVVSGPDLNWQENSPRSIIRVQMRSFYSLMNLLSYGVQVPEKDVTEGRTFDPTAYESAVSNGLSVELLDKFVVHWSRNRPADAFVAVPHRGSWWYIADTDYQSKRTFNAVYDLYNLEVVPSSGSSGPVLTLPVN